jgi:glycosyltransferase involved in cell wall biosynthesis
MSVSVVIPIHNEVENLPHLYAALTKVLSQLDREYEVILVDDGSTDGSLRLMELMARTDPHVRVLEFRKNFGQTAAMAAGIQAAMMDVIVTMDGDLQNDPNDIPLMLAKIDEGYDLVHGWRKDRQDAFLSRKLPSRIANWLISRVTVFPVHDLGCTLKAIRREIAQELELFGEMHRFIPILARCRGAKCAEVVTRHHPRRFGKSKYGLSRTLRVLLDLMTVKYLVQYLPSPMRLFGMLGLVCGLVGLLSGATTVALKITQGIDMTGNPLLLLSVGAVMLGGQFIVLGMLGELCARIYFRVTQSEAYPVRRSIHFPEASATKSFPVHAKAEHPSHQQKAA